MTPEEITEVTARIQAAVPEQEAYFGIFQYGGGPDESFIKANKQGLLLYAAKLLRAAAQVEETPIHENPKMIPFRDEGEDNWLDGDVFMSYIEPVSYSRASQPKPKPKAWFDRFSDNLQVLVLTGFGLFLLLSLLVGIGNGIHTILKWISS